MLTFAFAAALLPFQTNLLDRVRTPIALPNASAWAETRVTGGAECFGVHHDFTFFFNPAGKFMLSYRGPLAETFGCDGTTFWEVDRSRTLERLDFEDKDHSLGLALMMTSR